MTGQSRTTRTRPVLHAAQALVWWTLRGYIVVPVWTKAWPLDNAESAALTAALVMGSMLCLAPGDLPRLPVRGPALLVCSWDVVLTLIALVTTLRLWPGQYLLVLCVVGLCAVARVPFLSRAFGDGPTEPSPLGWKTSVAGAAALLLLLALFLSEHRSAPGLSSCDAIRPYWDYSDRWSDPPRDPLPEPVADDAVTELVGDPIWSVPDEHTVSGGSGDTLLVGQSYITVRSAANGEFLWHVRQGPRAPGGDPWRYPEAAQVGDLVLISYFAADPDIDVTAFEADSGRVAWCADGFPNDPGITPVPGSPDRFLAYSTGSDRAYRTLHDAADAAPIADLPAGQEADGRGQADAYTLVGEGRVVVWNSHRLTGYDTADGDILFRLDGAPDLPEGGREYGGPLMFDSVVLVDDTTVVAYAPAADQGEDSDRGPHLLVAYDAAGAQLWNTSGAGEAAVGEPLVGGSVRFRSEAFGGHVLVEVDGGDVLSVRADDGTVASRAELDESEQDPLCFRPQSVVDGLLLMPSGALVHPLHGVLDHRLPPCTAVTTTDNGVVVVGEDGTSFHPLP